MALAVNVKDYGWWSIPLSDVDTGPFPFQVLSSFFDNRYNPDDELMDDDRHVNQLTVGKEWWGFKQPHKSICIVP